MANPHVAAESFGAVDARPQLSVEINGGLQSVPDDMIRGQHLYVDLDASIKHHFSTQVNPDCAAHLGSLLTREVIPSLSIATFNPRAKNVRGLEGIIAPEDIHVSERVRLGGRVLWLTKFNVDYWYMLADKKGVSSDQMAVLDNSYVGGLRAAWKAGCDVIKLEAMHRTPVPEGARLIQLADERIRRRSYLFTSVDVDRAEAA